MFMALVSNFQARVIRLQQHQLPQAAGVLAESFVEDPVTNYFFPDQWRRLAAMEYIFGAYLKMGLRIGEVLTTSDIRGAAIWIHPGRRLSVGHALRSSLLLLPFRYGPMSSVRMIRYLRLVNKIRDRHPLLDAWYLFGLGVKQDYRGGGVGSALICPMLQIADAEQRQCYLETSTQRNLKFYKDHGFRIANKGIVSGSELQVWLMIRDAKTRP
jgi:GNAT superfamily N-acetyltransferase